MFAISHSKESYKHSSPLPYRSPLLLQFRCQQWSPWSSSFLAQASITEQYSWLSWLEEVFLFDLDLHSMNCGSQWNEDHHRAYHFDQNKFSMGAFIGRMEIRFIWINIILKQSGINKNGDHKRTFLEQYRTTRGKASPLLIFIRFGQSVHPKIRGALLQMEDSIGETKTMNVSDD